LFRDIYGLDDSAVGACYLSIGFGVVAGGYLNGRLLDWNYKVTAKNLGLEVDKKRGDDLDKFPIERARLRSVIWLHVVHLGILVGYGWVLEREAVSSLVRTNESGLGRDINILTPSISACLSSSSSLLGFCRHVWSRYVRIRGYSDHNPGCNLHQTLDT